MPSSISTYTVYSFNANLIVIIALIERSATYTQASLKSLKSQSGWIDDCVNRCPDSSCDWEWFRCCAESARSAIAYSSLASSCSPPQCTSCRPPPPASQSPPLPSPPPESPVSGLQAEQTNPHTGFISQASEGRREAHLDRSIVNDLRYEILSRRIEAFHSTGQK